MKAKSKVASEESNKKWSAHVADCGQRLNDSDCADVLASSKPYTPQPSKSTGTPPPPPLAETPTPKPSDGATWVSGRWVWDGFKWSFWSKGFWRIPDSDRDGKHTPTAPSLPPPPKNEAKTPSPIPGAVWTDGYWHWSFSAWIWIDGAWRVPPIAGAKWKPFVWRVDASGTVRLDPGAWISP